jgi:hypothetical protein
MKTRCLLLLLATAIAQGQVKRALLVGIDRYTPNSGSYKVSDQTRARLQAIHGTPSRSKLDSLEGAFNDAQAMKEMLVQKFGFDERNVIVLPNAQQPATADNILNLLQSFLIDQAKPGDISFFYYAGHGSRIRNTATRNAGGFDSTIVPADALLGVPDIRSKELARIYAQAPKKHVALTVIQDSCFSGAASRGAIARDRTRSQPPDLSISVNEKLDGPLPEDAGVLVISASQEYEPAAELASTDLNGAHGAFTWALLHALGVSPTGERVDRIFQRARALMQSRAPGQEPVLLAKNGLNTRDLFGQPAAPDSTLTMAASRVNGNVVKLNGGIAMDLHEGCELKRVRPSGDPVRLRITKVNGLSSSEAVIVDGPGVKPGDLFVLDKWVAPDREMLRVYFGPTAPREQIEAAVSAAQALKKSGLLIEDPTVHSPSHVIEWDGAHWTLRLNQPGAIREPADLAAVSKSLPHNAQVNLMLPPAADLALPPNVARVQAIDRADYVLLGRATDQAVEYAWALPDITEQDLRDRPSPRPLRSDWIPWNADAPSTLRQSALTLARVSGWLQLAASAPGSPWPYHLALVRRRTGSFSKRIPKRSAIPSRRAEFTSSSSIAGEKRSWCSAKIWKMSSPEWTALLRSESSCPEPI